MSDDAVKAAKDAAASCVPARGYYGDPTGYTDDDRRLADAIAKAAVAAARPHIEREIRAQIAAEARSFDYAEEWRTAALNGEHVPEGEGTAVRWALDRLAARIARGES